MVLLLLHRLLMSLLLALLVAASHGAPSGSDSYDPSLCLRQPCGCGNVSIRYPFYLSDETAGVMGNDSSYCGYPDLGIMCPDGKQAVLRLGDENYAVLAIDYTDLTVTVADQEVMSAGDESCPKVDHNVTLPPATWLSYSNTTVDYLVLFLNCVFTGVFVKPRNISPATCQIIDGPGLSFVLRQQDVPDGDWRKACEKIIPSACPQKWPPWRSHRS